MKDGLSIGRVARIAEVPIHTVRFYEKMGLIAAISRRGPGMYRVFHEDSVRAIRFIVRAKELMFSLEEIRHLLDLRGDAARRECAAQLARAKVASLEETMLRLRQASSRLMQLEKSCASAAPHRKCALLEFLETTAPEPARPRPAKPSVTRRPRQAPVKAGLR